MNATTYGKSHVQPGQDDSLVQEPGHSRRQGRGAVYVRMNVHCKVSKGVAESNLHSGPGPAHGTDSGGAVDCLSSTGRNGEAGLQVISGRMSQQISEWKAAWSSGEPAALAWLVSLLQVTVRFGFFIFFSWGAKPSSFSSTCTSF